MAMDMSIDDLIRQIVPLFEKKMAYAQETGRRELSLREKSEQNKTDLEYRKLDDAVAQSKYAQDWDKQKVGIIHTQNLSMEAAKSANLITQAGVKGYYDDQASTKANTAAEKTAKQKTLDDIGQKAFEAGMTVHTKYGSEGNVIDRVEGSPEAKKYAEGTFGRLNTTAALSSLSPQDIAAAEAANKTAPPPGSDPAAMKAWASTFSPDMQRNVGIIRQMQTATGQPVPNEAPFKTYEQAMAERSRSLSPTPLVPVAPVASGGMTPAEITTNIEKAYPSPSKPLPGSQELNAAAAAKIAAEQAIKDKNAAIAAAKGKAAAETGLGSVFSAIGRGNRVVDAAMEAEVEAQRAQNEDAANTWQGLGDAYRYGNRRQ